MPSLLLQKPSKSSKSKDHLNALERRLKLWNEGKLLDLLNKGLEIQSKIPNSKVAIDIGKISMKFKHLMQKGNVNGALKLLTNNMSNGVLPLNDATLNQIKIKHPEGKDASPDVLLHGPIKRIHPVAYEDIDESLILKAATQTKGGSGPSGMDADGWRRILASKAFGKSSSDLRKHLAEFIKKLCIENIQENVNDNNSLEAFVACRL